MAATTSSINLFLNDVRNAFQVDIRDSRYMNRACIEYRKLNQLHVFVYNPTLKPTPPSKLRLIKHRAHTWFELTDNKLYPWILRRVFHVIL